MQGLLSGSDLTTLIIICLTAIGGLGAFVTYKLVKKSKGKE